MAKHNKKAKAKAKAIKGGMPQDVADRVFKMQPGKPGRRMSNSTFSYNAEKVMAQMPTFNVTEKDLNPVEKLLNKANIDFGDGASTRPGDYLRHKKRFGGLKGSVNYRGETNIGFNLFAPKNKVSGPTVPSTIKVNNRSIGDSMFQDANQDGTMLGRGLTRIKNFFTR